MIRMIANNTSDYVATDLIHQLWCQHAENYDQLFPSDPHNICDIPCVYEHRRSEVVNACRLEDRDPDREGGKAPMSFGHVFEQWKNERVENANENQVHPSMKNRFSQPYITQRAQTVRIQDSDQEEPLSDAERTKNLTSKV